MRGSRTPDNVRAEAVGLALVKGVPAAAKETGIPQRSIREWRNAPEFAELRLSAREDVASVMWVAIQDGLDEVHAGLTNPNERLRDKADALFGLMQQHALMTGEATSRTEAKNITDELPANVKRELRRRYADLTRDPGDGVAPEGNAAGSAPA